MPVTISDEVLTAAHISEPELKQELALTLFQQERLTLAEASRLAEMSQLAFQALLAERQIPIHYGIQEFREDLRTLRQTETSLIVVSDTSPVLNLARIDRLELLRSLYRQVLIPSAVYRELTDSKRDLPPAIDLASIPWLIVVAAANHKRVRELRGILDPGEAEAIVVAIEHRADVLLVDERRGRRTATAAGLTVTGLIGVVAQAKRVGLIDLAKPVLDELVHTARFWIGPELYSEVLAELGET